MPGKVFWKRVGMVVGGALVAVLATAAVLYLLGSARLNRSYDIEVAVVPTSADSAVLDRGRRLATVALCTGCHGEDLSGDVLFDEPPIASVYASNLTSGQGGVGGVYQDADFVRAIRHGVNREGRGVMIMHSDYYHRMGRADLGALISYVKSVPPVDNVLPPTRGGPVGKVLIKLGMFDTETVPLIPAELIDHQAPLGDAPEVVVSAEYGEYLTSIALCAMCHGLDLQGAPSPDPEGVPGPNIAGYGGPGGWTEEQFMTTIRTGVNPFGKELDPEAMPWEYYGALTDDELRALWRYVTSLSS